MTDSTPTLRPHPDEETIAFAGRVFDLARGGGADQMRALLAQGLPPNLRNDKGDTLLMLAAYHLRTETVRVLLEGGADPEVANDRGQTPLAAACFKGGEAIVRLLLEHGARIEGHGGDGRTALMMAAMFNRTGLVRLLLEHGASREARDARGMTALDAARAIRLGADVVSLAGAVLASAIDGPEALLGQLDIVLRQLRTACFCTGSADLAALRQARLRQPA